MYLKCNICKKKTTQVRSNQKYCPSCRETLRQKKLFEINAYGKKLEVFVRNHKRQRTEYLRQLPPEQLIELVRRLPDDILVTV